MNLEERSILKTWNHRRLLAALAAAAIVFVLLMRAGGAKADGPLPSNPSSPRSATAPSPPVPIPPDPAANGYTVAPGVKTVKKRLLLTGYRLVFLGPMIWVDEQRFIVNVRADKDGSYDPAARGSRKQLKIAIVNVDTGELAYTPYEGWLTCYSEGRIAIQRVLFSADPPYGKTGSELAIGRYGEPLQVPVPGGTPKESYLNRKTCQLEPGPWWKPGWGGGGPWEAGVKIDTETATPVRNSGADLGRFDKNNPFFQNMGVAGKEKWVWRGANGQEKEIETNIGELFAGGAAYLPFEHGAYYFPIRMDTTLPMHVFVAKFNRLIYPDGSVVRLPIPDLVWNDYVNNGGRVGVDSWYTKAGVVWGIGHGKNSVLEVGLYLEDKARKQLVKLDRLRRLDRYWLFPDGCHFLMTGDATKLGSGSDFRILLNYYIYDLCAGE